jgi:tRNA-binding protein
MATFEEFQATSLASDAWQAIDIRVGRVVSCEPFPEGKYSTHILMIDFGPEIGEKKSLAKLKPNYEGPELIGRPVLGVINFPPRQIGKHCSEVLTLGVQDEAGNVVLVQPERAAKAGGKLH